MNLLLLGATSLPVGYLAYGYAYLFVPPKCVAFFFFFGGLRRRGSSLAHCWPRK
jgi:hypothetical protein